MDKKVAVNVKYSDKDISTAMIDFVNNVLHIWIVLPCIGVFILGTLYTGLKSGFSTYRSILLSIFLLILVLAIYYYYFRPIRGYQRIYQTRSEAIFEFSVENVKVKRDLSESVLKWEMFSKVIETKRNIFFIDVNKALTIIPKKCLLDDDNMQILKEILVFIKKDKYKII